MPTYQYACTACGHQLEVVQSFTDSALTVCPECDGSLRKLFSGVGVVFKGSGFYRTDSRSGTNSSVPASSTSGDSGASASSSGSTDGGASSTSGSSSAAPGASSGGASSSSTGSASAS